MDEALFFSPLLSLPRFYSFFMSPPFILGASFLPRLSVYQTSFSGSPLFKKAPFTEKYCSSFFFSSRTWIRDFPAERIFHNRDRILSRPREFFPVLFPSPLGGREFFSPFFKISAFFLKGIPETFFFWLEEDFSLSFCFCRRFFQLKCCSFPNL